MRHIKPKYYGYNGGYWNICKCDECELTGMYEDLYPTKPCPDCGSKVRESGSAKWNGQVWLTREQQGKIKIEQELIGTAHIEPASKLEILIYLLTFGRYGRTFKKINTVSVKYKTPNHINCRCSMVNIKRKEGE